MKKILPYCVVALVLGLLLTLVPLFTLAEFRGENNYPTLQNSLPDRMKKLESFRADTPKYSVADLTIFASSFVVALVAYLLFKRRITHHDYRWVRYPY